MKIYEEITSLREHKPWCGAEYWHREIIAAGKDEEFIELLEELYPEGLTSTELNDILWFKMSLLKIFWELKARKNKMSYSNKYFKCCICNGIFEGYGNNPSPIKENGRCCIFCNIEQVIPERLKRLNEKESRNASNEP